MSIEARIAEWRKQPGTRPLSDAEWEFIAALRKAASLGVGYGWMQQVIEWEWQEKDATGAWGPEYFEAQIRALKQPPR